MSVPDRLHFYLDQDNARLRELLRALDNRRYVIRSFVPRGYEPYFKEQARFISAHTSTAIEGNPLNEAAALRIMIEGADPGDPAQVEKVNLEEAYQFVEMMASDRSLKVDEGLIRTFNSISLKGLPDARNRGRYRVLQNAIVDSPTRQLRYMPPPPEAVPGLMADYVRRVEEWRSTYSGPFVAAMAHFALISIHPFDDGNGRTARLIADLLLDMTGWSADGMLSVSPLLLENRSGYYNALREVQGESFSEELDATPFVTFHTEQLMGAALRLEERVIAFNRQRDQWVSEFNFLNTRQVTALMFMSNSGPISSSRYATLTDTSQATALIDLGEMLKAGLVVREGAGPTTRYRFAGPTTA